MKRLNLISLVGVASLVMMGAGLTGCASGRVVENQRSSRSFRTTSVQSSEERASTAAAGSISKRFQLLLDEALYSENHFLRGDQLKIRWKITGYDEGSRALRYVVGFGAGKGKIVVKARFFDSQNRELASVQSEGSITMGAFGGSYETALSECADAIGKYARDNFYGVR